MLESTIIYWNKQLLSNKLVYIYNYVIATDVDQLCSGG